MDSQQAERLLESAEVEIQPVVRRIADIALSNQKKVLEAFWHERVTATDMNGSTGYGLDDSGRDKLEQIYAQVFGGEAALVRPQIVSGTHAIRLGLFGALRPGNHMVFATGAPYDTLESVVGIRPAPGSLAEWGVTYTIVDLKEDGSLDIGRILEAMEPQTTVVMFQRSRGYSARPALGIETLRQAFAHIHSAKSDVRLLVDNCYGEFVENQEPTDVGADLLMGSLIKNPGGGICTTGGYVVGRKDLVDSAAACLTAPGVGREAGPTHDFLRSLYQGLYLAPHVVKQALMGSVLAANAFQRCGLTCSPSWEAPRADLILAVDLPGREELLQFCRAVQSSAPVDAFVTPEPAPMAGYANEVVMAAGTFVQGASLELSADAPLRPPYTAFLQGGLTYEHVRIALHRILQELHRL